MGDDLKFILGFLATCLVVVMLSVAAFAILYYFWTWGT